MKTLYISDLDGTLLDNRAVISEYSKSELRRLTGEGMSFGVATARTSATVLEILSDTGVNVPVVLMNGVCIYDTLLGEYILKELIDDRAKTQAQSILGRHGLFGFWYSIKDEKLSTYYVKAGSPAAEAFIREREEKYGKVFTKIERFGDCLSEPIVYYSICDRHEVIEAAAAELKNVDGLRVEFYSDTYLEGYWYLEICSARASKKNAVRLLRELYGFERIVCFGDNLNDLPMFEQCDECCAVSNAVAPVRERADHIIGANDDDGVVRWLADEWRKQK